MSDERGALLEKLGVLRRHYMESLPVRLRNLLDYWETLQAAWDADLLEEFHREVHALAGSGGTFGFAGLSDEARHLERLLFALIQSHTAPATPIQLEEIALLLKRLQKVMEQIPAGAAVEVIADDTVAKVSGRNDFTSSGEGGEPRTVLLVEDDVHLAAHLAEQLEAFGYTVKILHTAKEIPHAFSQYQPCALVADVVLPEGDTAGPEAVTDLKKNLAPRLPAIFVSVRSDIRARLAAAKAGGDAYLTKPVDTNVLVEWLDTLTHRVPENPYRILLVDDDHALSEHYALILEGAGMYVRVCNKPLEVLRVMDGFAPDLMLMDIYMPEYNGNDLARVIRQMDTFTGIPIVYLSTEKSQDLQVQALLEGGDDFLTKPVKPENLVRVVSYRAMRFRQLRSLMTLDSLTRLLNHRNLKERLESETARARRENNRLCFVMIDLDNFKSVNDTYGHAVGDQVLKTLSRFLRRRLRSSDVVGRYGGEEFGLILPNTDLDNAWKLCEELRTRFAGIRHHARQDFTATFSAGVADFPTHDSAKALVEAADQALYLSKHHGRNQVTPAE